MAAWLRVVTCPSYGSEQCQLLAALGLPPCAAHFVAALLSALPVHALRQGNHSTPLLTPVHNVHWQTLPLGLLILNLTPPASYNEAALLVGGHWTDAFRVKG